MTVTSLQQTFVRTGTSLPASGDFEGQIFVDNSAGQVYRWDGSNWVSVGNSIDGFTITKNSQGQIQNEEKTVVVGDFENQNLGGWTEVDNIEFFFGTVENPSSVSADSGDYVYHLDGYEENDTGDMRLERDLDLSQYSFLKLWTYVEGDNGGKAELHIDGSKVANIGTQAEYNESTYEVDVSGYNGTHKVEIIMFDTDSSNPGNLSFYLDNIRLISPDFVETNTSDNAGGTP